MSTSKTWNGTSVSIPAAGERNWPDLSTFLIALADYAQTTNFQKVGIRVATSSPVTVASASDCIVVTNLSVAGAVAVNLPAGVAGQWFAIVDGKGDAQTNNITLTPAAGQINGASTYVIAKNRAGVVLAYNGTSWSVISEFSASSGTGEVILVQDANLTIVDNVDSTKKFQFQASGISAGNTRTITVPDVDFTLVGASNGQTLSNKTLGSTNDLTGATAANFTNTGTITLPTATTTLVGRTTTDTLQNKTMDASSGSNTFLNIPLTTAVTGTLPLTNGGTGQTSASDAINALVPTQSGNSGKVLGTNATSVSWVSVLSNPMTTTGDIIYSSDGSGTPAKLTGAAGVLHGAVGGAPSWSTIVNADVSGSAAIDGSKIVSATNSVSGVVTTSAQSFAGAKTFYDGVILDDAVGQSTLAYYREDDSTLGAVTFRGDLGGSNSAGVAIKITRVGRIVTLSIPVMTAVVPTTNSVALISNTALPTWARPAVQVEATTNPYNNGVFTNTTGDLVITTAGILQFYRVASGGTAYTNSANAGWAALSVTYTT